MAKSDKTYTLIVRYNDKTEEIEYLQETVDAENTAELDHLFLEEELLSMGWDEEGLKLISDSYCFGIA